MGTTTAVALSSDGAYAAFGIDEKNDGANVANARDTTVGVYEVLTGFQVARLETGEVAHVAFLPGGRELVTASLDSIQSWDVLSGNSIANVSVPGRQRGVFGPSFASSMALAPDGQTVATGLPDRSVVLWRLLAPARLPVKTLLKPDELNRCWADLAKRDAHWAYVAQEKLIETPEQTLTLFRGGLTPAALPSRSELSRLVDDLGHEDPKRRETASERMLEYGTIVKSPLREILRGQLSDEKRRGINKLLAALSSFSPADVRGVRAVRILERIDAPEARTMLEHLASGYHDAILSKQARLALEHKALTVR
jgi:hypothetical protein